MPKFSRSSNLRLDSADTRLQSLFRFIVKRFDCTIITGHRGEQAQNIAVSQGRSGTRWPNSKHNSEPSRAVDAGPYDPRARYGIEWKTSFLPKEALQLLAEHGYQINRRALKNLCRFYLFAGYVKGVAAVVGIPLRWGGDWDGDTFVDDNSFDDLVHFELEEGTPENDTTY